MKISEAAKKISSYMVSAKSGKSEKMPMKGMAMKDSGKAMPMRGQRTAKNKAKK